MIRFYNLIGQVVKVLHVGLEMGIQLSEYPKSLVPNKAGIEPHFGGEKFRPGY